MVTQGVRVDSHSQIYREMMHTSPIGDPGGCGIVPNVPVTSTGCRATIGLTEISPVQPTCVIHPSVGAGKFERWVRQRA